MKRMIQKILISVVGIIILVSGCEQQGFYDSKSTTATSEKKARLISVENIQLKDQIEQLNNRLSKQKTRYEDRLKARNVLLEKCRKSNEQLQKMFRDEKGNELESFMTGIITAIGKENKEIRAENEQLEVEIEQLKKLLERLEK